MIALHAQVPAPAAPGDEGDAPEVPVSCQVFQLALVSGFGVVRMGEGCAEQFVVVCGQQFFL